MSNAHSAALSELEAYVDDLETRLTAARAGYLANIDNANLKTISDISSLTATEIAYLDAKISEVIKQTALTGHGANSIGKILYDLYITRLTSGRCGFLDNIDNANLATIADISSLTATEIAHLDADISSVGAIPVFLWDAIPADVFAAVAGTWARALDASYYCGAVINNTDTQAVNDTVGLGSFYIFKEADYTVHVIMYKGPEMGKLHFLLNNVDEGEIDGYAASSAIDSHSVSLGTLAVGDYGIKIKMSDKNASASQYRLIMCSVIIVATP